MSASCTTALVGLAASLMATAGCQELANVLQDFDPQLAGPAAAVCPKGKHLQAFEIGGFFSAFAAVQAMLTRHQLLRSSKHKAAEFALQTAAQSPDKGAHWRRAIRLTSTVSTSSSTCAIAAPLSCGDLADFKRGCAPASLQEGPLQSRSVAKCRVGNHDRC